MKLTDEQIEKAETAYFLAFDNCDDGARASPAGLRAAAEFLQYQPEPLPAVEGGLLNRMIDASANVAGEAGWRNGPRANDLRQQMTAALRVAVEECLKEPSTKEWGDTAYAYAENDNRFRERDGKVFLDAQAVKSMLVNRRVGLLSPPAPKTLAERIEPLLRRHLHGECLLDTATFAQEIANLMEAK